MYFVLYVVEGHCLTVNHYRVHVHHAILSATLQRHLAAHTLCNVVASMLLATCRQLIGKAAAEVW